MRKLLLTAIVMMMMQTLTAQVYADGENLNEKDITFIELVGVNTSIFGVKMKIYVDYGQKVKIFKPTKITDSNGKVIKFNTMIDALNYFYRNGWDLFSYSQAYINGKMRYVYLLKKRGS